MPPGWVEGRLGREDCALAPVTTPRNSKASTPIQRRLCFLIASPQSSLIVARSKRLFLSSQQVFDRWEKCVAPVKRVTTTGTIVSCGNRLRRTPSFSDKRWMCREFLRASSPFGQAGPGSLERISLGSRTASVGWVESSRPTIRVNHGGPRRLDPPYARNASVNRSRVDPPQRHPSNRGAVTPHRHRSFRSVHRIAEESND